MFIQTSGTYLQAYTVSQPRKQQSKVLYIRYSRVTNLFKVTVTSCLHIQGMN
jgi:hypothetical protein